MSDILIRGMEMPPRCGRCDLCTQVFDDGMFDHYECCITAAIIDNLGEQMEDCPLVPIPPHGRLVDARVLRNACYKHYSDFMDGVIDGKTALLNIEKEIIAAPTIIPASEEETK